MSAPFRVGQILTANELNSLFDTPVVNVLGFAGVDNTGVKDSTTGIQTALNTAASAGQPCHAPAGTYLVTALTWPSGLSGFSGAGASLTTIKRSAANAISAANVLTATNQSGLLLSDMTIDGNKASQTTGSNGVLFDGCSDYQVSGVRVINQKTGTNYGDGIQLVNTPTTNTTGRGIVFDNCQCLDNDQSGVHVVSTGAGISVQGGVYSNNGLNGVYFDRGSTPVVNTMPDVSVASVRAEYNASGIVLTGFLVVGLSSVYTYGHGNDPCCGVSIVNNECNYNTSYGIFCQATGEAITGNSTRYNGTTSQAGICANAEGLTITGNNIEYNALFGLDCGGSLDMDIQANNIRYNSIAKNGTFANGYGVDLGASVNVNCSNNLLVDNGFGGGIASGGVDSGTFPFPFDSTNVTIDNNIFVNTLSTSSVGINCAAMPSNVYLTNNKFIWPDTTGTNCIVPVFNGGAIAGNTIVGSDTYSSYSTQAGTTLNPPDWADVIEVTNNAAIITGITTRQQNTYSGLCTGTAMTNRGSGYTSVPTVTPTGSWSVAPTFLAQLTQDGRVGDVVVLTRGSGITGALTIAISGGGGSNATANAFAGFSLPNGRQFRLTGTATKIRLQSGTTFNIGAASGTEIDIPQYLSATFIQQTQGFVLLAMQPANLYVTNPGSLIFYDTSGSPVTLTVDAGNSMGFTGTDATGAARTIFNMAQRSSSSSFGIYPTTEVVRASNNFIRFTGGATGAANSASPAVTISPNAADTDVAFQLKGKGARGVLVYVFSSNTTPTTGDIPAGSFALWLNSGDSSTKLYCNNAGSLKSVALT